VIATTSLAENLWFGGRYLLARALRSLLPFVGSAAGSELGKSPLPSADDRGYVVAASGALVRRYTSSPNRLPRRSGSMSNSACPAASRSRGLSTLDRMRPKTSSSCKRIKQGEERMKTKQSGHELKACRSKNASQ
jgi:hypothetical protein